MFSFVVLAQGISKLTEFDAVSNPTGCLVNGVPTLKCLEVVFGNLIFMASAVILLVLFIMLVTGALKYLLSGGESKKIGEAQSTIKWALIGVALFASSFLIINIIQALFLGDGFSLLKFTIAPTPTP